MSGQEGRNRMIPSGNSSSNVGTANSTSGSMDFHNGSHAAVPTVSIQDLDPEEAAVAVLERVQQRHEGSTAATIATASFDALNNNKNQKKNHDNAVRTKVLRLEAAIKARQEASEHVARHFLQDMMTDDTDEEKTVASYGLYGRSRTQFVPSTMTATRTARQVSSDGLLKGTSDSNPNNHAGLFQRRSSHRRTGANNIMDRGDGYVSTSTDGYVPNYSTTAGSNNNNNNSHGLKRSSIYHSYPTPTLPRWMRECCAMIHPQRVWNNLWEILLESHFLWIGMPCMAAAAICFYGLDNPRLYFLPGQTTIAVWLLFVFRQTVTLGLAQLTVYVVVDGIMLGTHLAVQTLGPLVTLAAATGKGWPAIVTTWGLWNLVLVHGNSKFQLNWLYWTDIELFNLNLGGFLVNSSLYTRCLVAAILGGLAVSAKRTLFALRFGRKQVAEFRPRLKRVLADVCLVDEIATLAAAPIVSTRENDSEMNQTQLPLRQGLESKQQGKMDGGSWSKLLWVPKIEYQQSHEDEDDEHALYHEYDNQSVAADGLNNNPPLDNAATGPLRPSENKNKTSGQKHLVGMKRSQRRLRKIKDMLDSWKTPDASNDNDNNKWTDISIHEILKFRRALAHLDEDNVFGDDFGSTATRDDCIVNSHSVYHRLFRLAQQDDNDGSSTGNRTGVLPFEVLELLCVGDDGTTENISKKRKIRKIFTPDRSGELPLLAFIQAVDQCYKRLVFLRASLKNSSLLDDVLERLFNGIFYFMLFLFLSSVLELHPWTLMVSITSILVSVSFAFGSSVSAYVDGVLLIAIRRPFDLGDRIFISTAEDISPSTDLARISWFVEDITLATTTLRCARTNEVCTVNNSSIASTRIVNLARSPNATIHIEFAAHISIFEGDKLNQFRQEMCKYVEERPRVWESVRHVRHAMFDADNERVDVSLALRHVSAWQEAARIKNDTVAVYRFLYDVGNKIGVHFSAPPEQKVIYQGGTLRRGDTDDFDGRGLLARSNIRSIDPRHVDFRSTGTVS